jgi:uncharacterized RDD family membrane protein YckC
LEWDSHPLVIFALGAHVRIAARAVDILLIAAIDALLGRQIGFGFDWLLTSAGIAILYFALMDVYVGGTLGKLALGLRVIGPKGGKPTMGQAFTREAFTVLGAIPFAGPLLALVAWVWIIVTIRSSPLRQGKHDLLAGGTRVVRHKTLN